VPLPAAFTVDKLQESLYSTSITEGTVYKINLQTSESIPLLPAGSISRPDNLEVHEGYLYVTNSESSSVLQIRVDNNDPVVKVINPSSKLGVLSGLGWDKVNQKLWIGNMASLAYLIPGDEIVYSSRPDTPLFPGTVRPIPTGEGLLVTDILFPNFVCYMNSNTLQTEAIWAGFSYV